MAACCGSIPMRAPAACWASRAMIVARRCPCRLAPSVKGAGTLYREARYHHPAMTVDRHPAMTADRHRVTMTARLPDIEVHLMTAPTADAVLAAVSATDADMRILLVEDEKDLQRLLKKALSEAGYVVAVAADGEEGHFLGDTEPYDAVVLDLGLPKMDGVTVLERWRKAGRKMPVLILTARDRWSDKVAGFDAGADDYLAKPFYTEEL